MGISSIPLLGWDLTHRFGMPKMLVVLSVAPCPSLIEHRWYCASFACCHLQALRARAMVHLQCLLATSCSPVLLEQPWVL